MAATPIQQAMADSIGAAVEPHGGTYEDVANALGIVLTATLTMASPHLTDQELNWLLDRFLKPVRQTYAANRASLAKAGRA